MTAPTEAEIRAAIADRIRHRFGDLNEMLGNALDPIVDSDMARSDRGAVEGWDPEFFPRGTHPGTLWMDLSRAEMHDLSTVIDGAIGSELYDILAKIVTDRVVSATIAFAETHPDIPRGRYTARESVTA